MNVRIIIAVIIAIVVVISAFAYYEHTNSTPPKGQVMSLKTGDNLSQPATRIVSLDPAATSTLYALGAYGDIVGGSAYDTYPPHENVTVVGDYPQMNLEDIYNLSPQVVISFDSNYTQASITKLLNAGINYVFLNSGPGTSLKTVEEQTTFLGELTGKESNASLINSWMNQSLKAINTSLSSVNTSQGLSAFYLLSDSGGIYTSGNGTFFNDMMDYAHLKNVAINLTGGFVPISKEVIANNTPQIIFLDQYVSNSSMTQYPFNQSEAVKNGKVFTLPNEDIFTEPSFRDIYGVAWMAYAGYNVSVSLPSFPINLHYNPDPIGNV